MYAIKPLVMSLAAATALTVSPIAFGPLPIPLGVTNAQAQSATVRIDVFFQPLAQYGVWVKHSRYHFVFCPKVDAKWRPYSHGHWIYMKNYGWYFASDEPFAWAVYHYGRWFHEARLGWCWVPGNAWAGAWVAWRRSNDFIGWAPLEPEGDGFVVDVKITKKEPPQPDWIFVPAPRFLEPRLSVVVEFGDQKPDVFQKTKFVGPVIVQNNIVVNNIINVNFIQQVTNKKVEVVEPKPVNDPSQVSVDVTNNVVNVFAPQIEPPKQDEAPQQAMDEDQAAQQLGNASEPSSEQPSSGASSEASSSAPASSASSSEAASSEAASSASSSEAASSEASSASSSVEPSSSAAASSSVEPSSSAVTPSSEEKASSSAATSSEAPASSSVEPSSSAVTSSSEAASASSSEEAAPSSSSEAASSAPASSEEVAPSSSAQKAPSSLECPEGYQIVDGKCVPIESSGDGGTASSAAQ